MTLRSALLPAVLMAALLSVPPLAVGAIDEIPILSKVSIETGKLIIVGKTRKPAAVVKLDGNVAAATANATRDFSFSLIYLPLDCIVELRVGSFKKKVVVANCGPKGVNPRGTWLSSVEYAIDDLVLFGGSTWRAKAASTGKQPNTNAALWEMFAAKGVAGPQGPGGATGATGAQGPQGEKGDKGDTGATGAQGPQGSPGEKGSKGDKGLKWRDAWSRSADYAVDEAVLHNGAAYIAIQPSTSAQPRDPATETAFWSLLADKGAKGDKGDNGDTGPTGATGSQGPQGATGPQGLQGGTGPQGEMGPAGAQGPVGPQGPAGPAGAFANARLVKQSCNDDQGWTLSGGTVYCIAACESWEFAISNGIMQWVNRNGGQSVGGSPTLFLGPYDAPFPRSRWFIYGSDSALGGASRGANYSSLEAWILCNPRF